MPDNRSKNQQVLEWGAAREWEMTLESAILSMMDINPNYIQANYDEKKLARALGVSIIRTTKI